MKKKSIQRIAAWLLAAGMMAGTFAQPMAVYAESAASIAASDSTTGDSITADADVVIATPTPVPDTGTDTTATPVPTADSQTPQDPASTAAPETTPAPMPPRTRQTMPPTRTTPPIRPPPSPRQTCKAASPCWRPRSSAWTRTVSSPMSARRPWPCRTRSPRPNRPPCRRWSMRRCIRPRQTRPTLRSMCPPAITPARWSFPMQPSSSRTPAATRPTSTTQTKTSS